MRVKEDGVMRRRACVCVFISSLRGFEIKMKGGVVVLVCNCAVCLCAFQCLKVLTFWINH